MDSFLKEIEKYYSMFGVTSNEIVGLFRFPQDIIDTWRYLLAESNTHYFRKCGDLGRSIYEISQVTVGKDPSEKCYLKVVGNDNHTILIIRQDDSAYEDYRNMVGTKITEEEFAQRLDRFQRDKLEKAKISSRFLKTEVPPIDLCEEMNIPLLLQYYQYINNYLKAPIKYEEPENTVGPAQYPSIPRDRKNPVIDWELRERELLKRNPKRIIAFEGEKTGSIFEAYIYERDGLTLAVVEPKSGTEYQYNLNLGTVDKNDLTLIEEMIKSALEAKEEIAMLDDAIMRKNHTTLDAFKENLDIFLNSAKTQTKFYYDVRKSDRVYGR